MRVAALAMAVLLSALLMGQNRLPPGNPQARQELRADAEIVSQGDDPDVSIFKGHLRAEYRGYKLFADWGTFNKKTQIFRLEGNARLIGKSSDITGDVIVIDFTDDTFHFEDGRARLSPEALRGESKEDVFLTTSSGSGSLGEYELKQGMFTTCDKVGPHFHFDARSMRVRPGKNIRLRDARLDVLGHTIFGVPYLVIPLIDNGRRYLPDVGQDPTEGYFVKMRFSTPLKGDDFVDTRVEFMSKLGTGLGLDYNYDREGMDGRFEAFSVFGSQTSSTVNSRHSQELGAGKLILTGRYQQQNYLTAPQTTQVNTRAQYVLPWNRGTTRFSWFRVSNDRSTFSSVSQSLAVNDSRTWDSGLTTRLDLNLARSESRTSSGKGTDSQRLDIRFNSHQEFRSFGADLIYQRSLPVGESASFFSATDRTPMLSLKTDARKLFDAKTARLIPFRTQFDIGELADPASGGQITRINFDVNMTRTESMGKSSLQWGGRFKQGMYSDDTAQYVLDYNTKYSYRFGGRSRFDLGYRNHRAFGFTPLSIDRTGRNDAFALDLVWEADRTLELSARTGYDVLMSDRGRVPWQQVWLRSDWKPNESFQFRTSSIYDTFNQVWSNIRLDASYVEGDFRIGVGGRYDARRSVWGSVNLIMQGFTIGKTTFATALNWNGFRERFDAQHFSIIYSLHKAEAVLDIIDNQSGFRSGRQIAFFIRLKAFPTRSTFGSGTRGQAIGSQSGFGF